MKRLKRTLPLALTALLLVGCGNKSYAGTYLFQMGKVSGAHASASIELGTESYVLKGKDYGQKMTLRGQVAMGAKEDGEEAEEGESLSGGIQAMLAKGVTINGYYNVEEKKDEPREHLKLGFGLDFLKDLFGDLIEDVEESTLPPEVIEQFVYGEIDASKIYLQIPVSFTDLQMQLYWYGFDLNWMAILDELVADDEEGEGSGTDSSSSQSSAPAQSSSEQSSSEQGSSAVEPTPTIKTESHVPGTKPTKEQIDKINETYPASHNGKKFRNFYTISIGLTRQ